MTQVIIKPDQNNPFCKQLKKKVESSNQLVDKIRFNSVEVDIATKTCTLQLKVPEGIKITTELEELGEEFFTIGTLEYQIEYYDPDLPLEVILENNWEQLIKQIKQECPQTNGWLSLSNWQIKGNKLEVEVENEIAVDALESNRCDRVLAQILARDYQKQVTVEFVTGDFQEESTQLANQQAQETEAYMDSLVETIAHQEEGAPARGQSAGSVWLGGKIKQEPVSIAEITGELRNIVIKGEIFTTEIKELQSGSKLVMFAVTDGTNSITVKLFEDQDQDLASKVSTGAWVKVAGKVEFDTYDQELMLKPNSVVSSSAPQRVDEADTKRAELHLHTKISDMDSVLDVEDAIEQAAEWGHPAIAITDHGVVQSFPEAYNAAQDKDIKLIYGLEAYLVDDGEPIILNPVEQSLEEATYVVFDLETTGFNPHRDEIIEIGATKIVAGQISDTYQTFVQPEEEIPQEIVELTGIKQEMVADAPSLEDIMPEFLDFVGEATLVAHNLSFDLGFIEDKLRRLNHPELANSALDTLDLSRALLPEMKSHKLKKLAARFNKDLANHHRADDDAQVTAEILLELIDLATEEEITKLTEINQLTSEIDYKRMHPYHTTILVKNQQGLKNLYQLVSQSHINNFHRVPRILKSELLKKREGLIIGSACEAGQLYKAILHGKSEDELVELAKFYDYLEVQPLGNNQFLLAKGEVDSHEELQEINRKIYELGNRLGKPVIAAGDVHFLNPEDDVYRRVLKEGQGFDDAANQPPLYLRTTEEMLAEFDYFSSEEAQELVVDNPRQIYEGIEEVKPVPDGLFTPEIEGAEEEIRQMAYNKAREWYGDPLPDLVVDRLESELDSIIGNGYAVIYLISHKLVKKSLSDGYLVGSRGSVGSSFAATMTDITEVNPLPPHYRCPECKHANFFTDGSVGVGVDLPDKDCPECGAFLIKDGYDIPFEVFLGFEGDKVPDIDLNFSGEYQPEVHQYTEELFGEEYVYRAGTISTIADRTAYGFVKGHMEDNDLSLRQAEIDRLSDGCTGVKKTTGQHPGGLMVVPQNKDIHDFTPIQRPANDLDSDTLTTHFDYHSISGRILKLDILGHDDPTSIRMLQDFTGVDPKEIPLDDEETMSIFSSIEPLGVTEEEAGVKLGTLGIPEFGTQFVRGMLRETRPATFAELVRISGLSHGADVWLNNAQDLIRSGTAELAEVISVRDDIMNYLLQKGVEPSQAFWIMEHVRKGKGLTEEEEQTMRENDVPNWYIESCKKINYMFPKAHAAAYVMMAFRIAYFKVHYPKAFYTTFFTIKASDFDAQIVIQGREHVEEQIQEIKAKGNDATAKDNRTRKILQIVVEALARGVEFAPVDLYDSLAYKFTMTEEGLLRPPFISLDGIGSSAAQNLVDAKAEGEYTSIENLKNRAAASKTVIEALRLHGCLDDLPETNQLSLFG
ncbi:PolC-type DNA polymerase III [Halanaerobaculum tunisiense]